MDSLLLGSIVVVISQSATGGSSTRNDAPLLSLETPIESAIAAEDPVIETPALLADYADAPVRGKTFRLDPATVGDCTIVLRSHFFDAYLVLRDATNAVVGEDDDGLVRTHARIVVAAEQARRGLLVQACALHGELGAFELRLVAGAPTPLTPKEREGLEFEDATAEIAALDLAGAQHSVRYADALTVVGYHSWTARHYVEAEELFRRELALREELQSPDHPATARALFNLAAQLARQKRYAEAIALHERALHIREKALGPQHPETNASLVNLGHVLERAGRDVDAIALYERAFANVRQVLGPDHEETVRHATFLLRVYESRGLLLRALAPAEVVFAAAVRRRGATHPETLAAELHFAGVLGTLGRYGEARAHLEHVVAARRETLGPEDAETASAMVSLAGVLAPIGRWEEAGATADRARAILEAAGKLRSQDWNQAMQQVAMVHLRFGRRAESRECFERALRISIETLGRDDTQTAECLSNLANALGNDEVDRAGECLAEAAAIYEKREGPNSENTALALSKVSSFLFFKGRNDEAKALGDRAIAILRDKLGPGNPTTAGVEENHARALIHCGKLDDARSFLRDAFKGYVAHFAETLWALSEDEQLQYTQSYRHSLDLLLRMPATANGDEDATTTAAQVLEWKGRVARSCVDRRARLSAAGGSAAAQRIDDLQLVEASLSHAVYESDPTEPADRAERMANLRRRKEQLELELAQSVPGLVRKAPSPDELSAALPAGAVAIDFLVHEVEQPAAAERFVAQRRLHAWIYSNRVPVRSLDVGPAEPIETAMRRVRAKLDPSRSAGVVAALPSDDHEPETELSHLLWDPIRDAIGDAPLVVVSPDSFLGELPFEILLDADGRTLIEKRSFVYLQDLASLPQVLSSTASHDAAPQPDFLVVGGVDYNRVDALPHEDGDRVNDAAKSDGAPSLRGMTAFWRPLPATLDEAASLDSLNELQFGDQARRQMLTGPAATEERLKIELPRYRYVHLATHGFFEPEGLPSMLMTTASEPERSNVLPGYLSGLVCAGVNRAALTTAPSSAVPPSDAPADAGEKPTARDDGYLSAEELTWLDLSRVELIVLSACDTGLGRAQSGEGMLGLRRSLRLAGAKTVVSSLWKVNDEVTAELMKRFYLNLWCRKLGKIEALHAAQLSLLRENVAKFHDAQPSTWGAFVLDGDWR